MPSREFAQIDFLSGPRWPYRWGWSHDAGKMIDAAQRVGVSALRAARVEQKIVKIPKNEVVITLGCSKAIFVRHVDLESDLTIHQQSEKVDARKTVLPTEMFDLLRYSQYGDGGRNLRIANFEQRAGER